MPGPNYDEQRCYETCPEPWMTYVCQDDEDCAGIKLITADPNRPYESPPKVDSYCRSYDWSGPSWYPIPRWCAAPTQ